MIDLLGFSLTDIYGGVGNLDAALFDLDLLAGLQLTDCYLRVLVYHGADTQALGLLDGACT